MEKDLYRVVQDNTARPVPFSGSVIILVFRLKLNNWSHYADSNPNPIVLLPQSPSVP